MASDVDIRTRMDRACEDAGAAFWQTVAQHFPEITSGDVAPDGVHEWEVFTARHIRSWVSGNLPAVEVGMRVRLRVEVQRYPHFIAAAGRTGVVSDVSDAISVRMTDFLPGAEDWNNEIVWSDDEALVFWQDCEQIGWQS